MGLGSIGKSISKAVNKVSGGFSDLIGGDAAGAIQNGVYGPGTKLLTRYTRSGTGRRINKDARRNYDNAQPATYGVMPNVAEDEAQREAKQAARDAAELQKAEESKARGQIAARIRRTQRERINNRGVVAGGLGTGGPASTFAALLGL